MRTFPPSHSEIGLENQRIPAVPLFALANSRRRANGPSAVFIPTQERRHARVGVETRHTQPIDFRSLRNQCGALHITNESVIFDSRSHRCPPLYMLYIRIKVCRRLSRERNHIFNAAAARKHVSGLID